MSSTKQDAKADAKAQEHDAYGFKFEVDPNLKRWSQMETGEKVKFATVKFVRVCIILGALYAFVCSLSFLANGFRLVAGKEAGKVFANSELFNNPVAGMLVGVLVTVLVQSSSTSTSIVITMVAADLLTVKQAISLVMGANIGTSVTSTIVALGQATVPEEFQRAFAAATVHDMFNMLSVVILLPIEAATGYLYNFSDWLISLSPGLESQEKPPDILKALTKPLTKQVMKLDKKLISDIAKANGNQTILDGMSDRHMLKYLFDWDHEDLSDGAAGVIVLIGALLILCVSLYLIVFQLKQILQGHVAEWLHKSVNGDIQDRKCGEVTIPLKWVSGYLAIATGLGITICVQSSSITTAALTPLVGVGVLSVDRMYPVVLGANIGTCITGVLAALAASASKLEYTLQVAYAHLLFNISGIFIFYVIWPMRQIPISMAKELGCLTARYKWFAIAYLIFAFFLIPLLFMGLSFAGEGWLITGIVLTVLGVLFVIGLNYAQTHYLDKLPEQLKTWEFLPLWMRSLEPFDRVVFQPISSTICCKCVAANDAAETTVTMSTSSADVSKEMHQGGESSAV